MSDRFIAFEQVGEEHEAVFATDFDWAGLADLMGESPEGDEIEMARRQGAEEMLNHMLTACFMKMDHVDRKRRASSIGVRLVAIAHALKTQTVKHRTMTEIADALGVTKGRISQVTQEARNSLRGATAKHPPHR